MSTPSTYKLSADEISIEALHRDPNPSPTDLKSDDHIICMFIKPSQHEGRLGIITSIDDELGRKDINTYDKTQDQLIIRGRKNYLTQALCCLHTSGMLQEGVYDDVASRIDEWRPQAPSHQSPLLSARERHWPSIDAGGGSHRRGD